jgi:hypothetical protein
VTPELEVAALMGTLPCHEVSRSLLASISRRDSVKGQDVHDLVKLAEREGFVGGSEVAGRRAERVDS